MKHSRFFLILLIIVIISSAFPQIIKAAQGGEQILHYRRITRVLNTGVEEDFVGEIEILLLSAYSAEYQDIFEERITPRPEKIFCDQRGNRYALIKLPSLEKGQSIDIIYECNLLSKTNKKYSMNRLEQEIKKSGDNSQKFLPAEIKKEYLKEEKYIEPNHQGIKELALALSNDQQDVLNQAYNIFSYVNTQMEYDESNQYARKGSISAFYNQRGICTDFASLTVALMRASGIPSRMIGGYILNEHQGKPNVNGNEVAHAWVEFFIDGIGWLPADPTHFAYVDQERVVASNFFAALNDWGYVITSYGVEASQYRIRAEHFGGTALSGTSADAFVFNHRHLNDEIFVLLNKNSRVLFPDAKPIITDVNRTFVPLRMIFQALGARVVYQEEDQKTISSYKNKVIELAIDSTSMLVDEEEVQLDMAPYIDQHTWRTMIPLRAVAEAFGIEVHWLPGKNEIILEYE